jgi:predicted DNA-binding antitoxin AbrB/MazE fold protein
MPKIIKAVYEDGVFKPLEKVDLKEGERVRLKLGNIVEKTRGILKDSKIEEIIEEIESEGIL